MRDPGLRSDIKFNNPGLGVEMSSQSLPLSSSLSKFLCKLGVRVSEYESGTNLGSSFHLNIRQEVVRLPLQLPGHLTPPLLQVVDQPPQEHRVRLGLVGGTRHLLRREEKG